MQNIVHFFDVNFLLVLFVENILKQELQKIRLFIQRRKQEQRNLFGEVIKVLVLVLDLFSLIFDCILTFGLSNIDFLDKLYERRRSKPSNRRVEVVFD